MDACRRPDFQRIPLHVLWTYNSACLRTAIVRRGWRQTLQIGLRKKRSADLFRFHPFLLILHRVVSSHWFRSCSIPALKERLKSVGHAVPSRQVAPVFVNYRRTREVVWVVGFEWRVQSVSSHSLRILFGTAVGHKDRCRTVEVGEIDFALVIVPKMRDERCEPLAPLDFVRHVRGPDLDQTPGRLDRSLEYDDYLEVFGKHGFGRKVPERTRRGDPMGDRYRPEEEDKVIPYTGLSDEFERKLAEREQLTLFCQPASDKECSDRRTDDVRLAKIADAEDEIVETISHTDDGMLTEDDRLQ